MKVILLIAGLCLSGALAWEPDRHHVPPILTLVPECRPDQLNWLWPNFENAARFYQCQAIGMPVGMPCAPGTLFGFEFQVCVHAHQWVSPQPPRQTHPPPTDPTTKPTKPTRPTRPTRPTIPTGNPWWPSHPPPRPTKTTESTIIEEDTTTWGIPTPSTPPPTVSDTPGTPPPVPTSETTDETISPPPTLPTAAPTLPTAAPTLPTAAPTLPTAAPTLPTAAPTPPTPPAVAEQY